jgi:hypothetical protein
MGLLRSLQSVFLALIGFITLLICLWPVVRAVLRHGTVDLAAREMANARTAYAFILSIIVAVWFLAWRMLVSASVNS